MTVKTQLVVSLLITVTAIAFAGRSARPEPLKTIDTSRLATAAAVIGGAPASRMDADHRSAGLKRRVLAPVASVTRRLDLTKLTLADFGDAE